MEVAPHLQAVAVKEAAGDNNDSTLEYFIEAANTVILVDTQTQYSRPSSRPGSAVASPNPLLGIYIAGIFKAVITEAQPVYQAPRRPPPSLQTPPPPPLYADSAPQVRRQPPPALLVARPCTRSLSVNEPLLEPLFSDTRYFFVELLQN